jgi:hypothetical protein
MVVRDRHSGYCCYLLVVLWKETQEGGKSVLCRYRRLSDPYWEWSEIRELE